jgi:hypothetical protein
VGGNLFARVGMHPALREVSDSRERGGVTNLAWRRYGAVNGLALASILAGWAGARLDEASPRMLSRRERRLALAKHVRADQARHHNRATEEECSKPPLNPGPARSRLPRASPRPRSIGVRGPDRQQPANSGGEASGVEGGAGNSLD